MIKVDVRVTDGLSASLDRFAKDVQEKVLFSGAAAMASFMQDEVKSRVPVKTGLLQSAIYRAYSPERSTDEVKVYRISWNKAKAPHGQLVEFGTSRAAAQPFMRPAADRMQDAIRVGQSRMAARIREL